MTIADAATIADITASIVILDDAGIVNDSCVWNSDQYK